MLNGRTFVASAVLLAGLAAVTAANAEEVKADSAPKDAVAAPADTAPASKDDVAAAGDVVAGGKVFKKCKACHSVEGKDGIGPHLNGVIGRAVGSVEGFKYSPAMTEYAAEQPEWTEEALEAFLRKPKAVIKKTKMSFPRLSKDDDLANIMAFLRDTAAAE